MKSFLIIEFDDDETRDSFTGWWLDGGGETYDDFSTIEWTDSYMKVKKLIDEEVDD